MIRAGAMEEDGIPRQAEWERREREGGGGGREGGQTPATISNIQMGPNMNNA